MDIRKIAQALGGRGVIVRAKVLTTKRRRQIASMGGLSRSLSRHAASRVADNFKALAVLDALPKDETIGWFRESSPRKSTR